MCDYTSATLNSFYVSDLNAFASTFPNLPAPVTHRTHCIVWSDWATQPQLKLSHGIRFDTNYYYWPPEWVLTVRACSLAQACRCASPISTAR